MPRYHGNDLDINKRRKLGRKKRMAYPSQKKHIENSNDKASHWNTSIFQANPCHNKPLLRDNPHTLRTKLSSQEQKTIAKSCKTLSPN